MGKRNTMNVDVPQDAQDAIKQFCEREGRIQREVVGRVLTWFGRQKAPVRSAVLGEIDEGMEVAYAEVLEHLAQELRSGSILIPSRLPGSGRRVGAGEPAAQGKTGKGAPRKPGGIGPHDPDQAGE